MKMTKYNTIRPSFRTGDLLLFRGTSALSWAIRKFSRGDTNHASMILRSSEYDRVMQIGAVGRGVLPTRLSEYVYHYDGAVFWLPLKDEFRSKERLLGHILLGVCGTKYDYRSLFANIIKYVPLDSSKFFCSEAVQFVGIEAGLPVPIKWEKKAARPCDLEKFGWWGPRVIIK